MTERPANTREDALVIADTVTSGLLAVMFEQASTFAERLSLLVQTVKLRECDRRSLVAHVRSEDLPAPQEPT